MSGTGQELVEPVGAVRALTGSYEMWVSESLNDSISWY